MRLVDQFTLRLGNPRYPFMKFVVGEHLIEGEYFFSVDTHEGMLTADPANSDEVASSPICARSTPTSSAISKSAGPRPACRRTRT